jgi:hypothetical protein
MSFALAYLVFNAPPVSIRRLTCLCILAFTSAVGLLTLAGVRGAVNLALVIGAAVTVAAWIFPLLRFIYGVARTGTLETRVFDSVSASAQFAYGFVLTLVVVFAVDMPLKTWHALSLNASIPHLVGVAAAVGMCVPILIHQLRSRSHFPSLGRRRPLRCERGHSHSRTA